MGFDKSEIRKRLKEQRSGTMAAKPRIGLLPTGHFYCWDQFPGLKKMGMNMYAKLRKLLGGVAQIVAP